MLMLPLRSTGVTWFGCGSETQVLAGMCPPFCKNDGERYLDSMPRTNPSKSCDAIQCSPSRTIAHSRSHPAVRPTTRMANVLMMSSWLSPIQLERVAHNAGICFECCDGLCSIFSSPRVPRHSRWHASPISVTSVSDQNNMHFEVWFYDNITSLVDTQVCHYLYFGFR